METHYEKGTDFAQSKLSNNIYVMLEILGFRTFYGKEKSKLVSRSGFFVRVYSSMSFIDQVYPN